MNYAPIITATQAAGSNSSPYFFDCNISQKLCCEACEDETPVFSPTFAVKAISKVGTSQYMVTIHVEGLIAYKPCKGNCCCTKSQVLAADFAIALYSTSAISNVTVTKGEPISAIAGTPCKKCSRDFVSEIPLTVTVTTA